MQKNIYILPTNVINNILINDPNDPYSIRFWSLTIIYYGRMEISIIIIYVKYIT